MSSGGQGWRKSGGNEGRGRVDEGKPNVHVPCLSCALGFSRSNPVLVLVHASPLSPLSRLPLPVATKNNVHTTTTATQCPRLCPDMPLRRHDSQHLFFSPCASQGTQRMVPLPISSGTATQQGRVRGTRRRATLAGGSASGARVGGDGCGGG